MGITFGILIPLFGTSLGAALVFLIKSNFNKNVEKALSGLAAGVMVAASVWSLIMPSIELCANLGKLAFLPATIGFLLGIAALTVLDRIIPQISLPQNQPGFTNANNRIAKMLFAVTLHNIPEGMAVGVAFAGVLSEKSALSFTAAAVLAVGIAIQNIPEGAIISMPLFGGGMKKSKSFITGVISGIVEPIAAGITLLFVSIVATILPYLLAFAAGAMIYVVVEDLIPDSRLNGAGNYGTAFFAVGFTVMMILDVALG